MNREQIVDKCIGCDRIVELDESQTCNAYEFPRLKWRLGNCPLASHVRSIVREDEEKQRVGQQKGKRKKK